MRKVLFISYDGLTDHLGQSQVLPYVIGLSQLGYQFTILSTEKPENYQKRQEKIRALISPYNIDWQFAFYKRQLPVFSALQNIRQLRRKAFQLMRKQNFDIIHGRSHIGALVGSKLKQVFPTLKFIFDMRGFWADERVDGGLWNLKNPIYKFIYQRLKKQEKDLLLSADYTISLTHNAESVIHSWKGLSHIPIAVIPCCVDVDLFDYQKYPTKPSDTPFTLSYLGSIGTWYLLDEMLHFFKLLLSYKPQAEFLFISGEPPEYILARAEALQIPQKHIRIQSAERVEVPRLLAESDVSIFFIKNAFSKKASSATKMGEILAMGIPIIANTQMGDQDFLFEKYTCGTLIDQFSPTTYQKVIQNIDALLHIKKDALRQTALSYFSLQEGIQAYQKVYQKV
ncbi:MAG: glycosyltransferase [Thermonemataceae bacterium]